MKRQFVVRKIRREDDLFGVSGPFVVIARNPSHAARLTRHFWPAYLGDHVQRETHALCVAESGRTSGGFISDRRGKRLPSVARLWPEAGQ